MMNTLMLELEHEEVLALYAQLSHQGCPESLDTLFVKLQKYLFERLTVQEIQELGGNR